MPNILQTVTLANAGDLSKWRDGTLPEEQVRQTEVQLLVDTAGWHDQGQSASVWHALTLWEGRGL